MPSMVGDHDGDCRDRHDCRDCCEHLSAVSAVTTNCLVKGPSGLSVVDTQLSMWLSWWQQLPLQSGFQVTRTLCTNKIDLRSYPVTLPSSSICSERSGGSAVCFPPP